ncbi:50S ribosomal protein L30 [Acidobacteriia bacterium AH_259_A11_L15]|nr:50S ribosomal protein L30 [Acidobacteriia bacterium AH_259_A11_L15]
MTKRKSDRLKIKWVRSGIGCPENQRATIRGLGLRRLNQVVERPDTPAVRGMVKKIPHLVTIVEE